MPVPPDFTKMLYDSVYSFETAIAPLRILNGSGVLHAVELFPSTASLKYT
jgi:hypothetical protein